MNELDIKERDHFLSLSEEEKQKYLKDHHMVILDEKNDGDGSVLWTVEFCDMIVDRIEKSRREGESLDEASSRFVTEAL